MNLRQAQEKGVIDYIKKISANPGKNVLVGIGDDTAVIKIDLGSRILYTSDMLVEGTHFKRGHKAFDIGYKSLACSISDIAAKGGVPKFASVSLGAPGSLKFAFLKGLYEGMRKASSDYNLEIVTGDTVRSRDITIDVSMLGLSGKQLVLRSTAKSGDYIFVSGKLGNNYYKHGLKFYPRLKEAQFLVDNFKINSMMDLSDGLAVDLNHICSASNVGAIVYADKIPLSKNAKSVEDALCAGEDFELLFTVAKATACELTDSKKYKFYCIGKIVLEKMGVKIRYPNGRESYLLPKGFKHF